MTLLCENKLWPSQGRNGLVPPFPCLNLITGLCKLVFIHPGLDAAICLDVESMWDLKGVVLW